MNASEKMDIVREILAWGNTHGDSDKLYTIQSFLLGWTSAQAVHNITDSQRRVSA